MSLARDLGSATASAVEVPYTEDDLRGLKKQELVTLVRRQLSRWPTNGKFNESKTTIAAIKAALLDHTNGFTKLAASPAPSSRRSCGSAEGPVDPRLTSMAAEPSQGNDQESPLVLLSGRLGDDNGGIINAPGADEIECTADNAKPISPPDGDSDMNSHRSTTIEAVENHASPSNEGNDQMHRVRVYIDDMRCKDNIIRTATTLALSTSDRDECDADEWRTNTRDLLRRLQRTAAALNGPVRLSFPDKLFPQYNMCFVQTQPHERLEETEPDLDHLVIPDSDVFQLVVEQPNGGVSGHGVLVPPAHESAAVAETMNIATTTPRAEGSSTRQHSTDAQIAWLSERAKERAGYEAFRKGQHHIQCNADVVSSWRFAVEFCEKYNKQFLAHIGSPAVTKNVIQRALGVGATWLSEAENALSIVRKYGRGGTQPRQPVMDATESRAEKPEGMKALYRFLKNQD